MAGCLIEFLFKLVILLLLLPVGALVGTPVILIWSCFGPRGYRDNVQCGYQFVWRAWCFVAKHA